MYKYSSFLTWICCMKCSSLFPLPMQRQEWSCNFSEFSPLLAGNGTHLCGTLPSRRLGLLWWVQQTGGAYALCCFAASSVYPGSLARAFQPQLWQEYVIIPNSVVQHLWRPLCCFEATFYQNLKTWSDFQLVEICIWVAVPEDLLSTTVGN